MTPSADRPLLVALALLLCAGAWLRPLSEPDEGRYSEAAREMLAGGDWLLPRQCGVVYPDKPPGVYWLMAAAMAVLGPRPFATRLPALLAWAGIVLLLLRRNRDRAPPDQPTTAALIAASSPLLLALGQLATLDLVLSFFVTAAILNGSDWLRGGGKRHALYAGSALGAAFLVKGPIGWLIPIAIWVVHAFQEGRGRDLRKLLHPALWFPALALGLPWYLAAAHAEPGLWDYWFHRELLGRVASDVHHRSQPLWFFPALFLAAGLPWIVGLLHPALRNPPPSDGDPRLRSERRLAAVWALLPVLLFSLPESKQPAYLAPAIPGMGLWLATWWSRPTLAGARKRIGFALLLLGCAAFAWTLDPQNARSDDPAARALRDRGAETWDGAQLMGWSYGLCFRLGRTDLQSLGSPPRAWDYAGPRGKAPPQQPVPAAFAAAARKLAAPSPAFVVIHEVGHDQLFLSRLGTHLRSDGTRSWLWLSWREEHLLANRPPEPGAPPWTP